MNGSQGPQKSPAQQAADAAMVEIVEHCYPADDPPFLIVHPTWLRAFLANYIEGLFGGEQAAMPLVKGEPANATPSPVPATPIDTEALTLEIVRMARVHDDTKCRCDCCVVGDIEPAYYYSHDHIRHRIDTALAQPVEVCFWVETRSGFFVTSCRMMPMSVEQRRNPALCGDDCPGCRKPIREVPYEEVGDGA